MDARFRKLDALTTLKRLVHKETEQETTEAEDREHGLISLSQHPEFEAQLVPMFEERVEEIEQAIPQFLDSHPQLAALEGRKAEALTYLRYFKKLLEGE